MGLSNCLTEVVFLRPKLTQIDRSTCKVRLFATMTRSFSKGLARAVLSKVRGRNTGCAGSQITRGAQGGSAGGIRDNARRGVLLNGLAPAWRSLSNSKLLVPVPISHSRAGRLPSLAWRSRRLKKLQNVMAVMD